MCTVTYIPSGKNIFLNASRDEQSDRPSALPPETYDINGRKILFPKDPVAGGTWFAVNEKGEAVVFLNGASTKYIHRPPYGKSRGLVLLDLLSGISVPSSFDRIKLEDIAPFTAIITESGNLFLAKWDGTVKSLQKLDARLSYIWSSVTLYDPGTIQKRQCWFDEWVKQHPRPTATEIMHFHRYTGEGDPLNDLRMNRNDKLFTHSICVAQITDDHAAVRYLDLQQMQETKSSIRFLKTAVVNA
jgi:hypothetical protein